MQKLIVHGQKGCPDCVVLKARLDKHNIEYEYREDLTRDQRAPQIYIKVKDSKIKKWDMLIGLDECLDWLGIKYET